jgi:hypothetical protein
VDIGPYWTNLKILSALVIYPFVIQFVRDTGITGGEEAKTGFYAGILVRGLA